MSTKAVDQTVTDFANSAKLAHRAGYDGVEIMGSEGYLVNQMLTARTNDRPDRWGGSAENRIRFPVEIVERVREAVGDDFIVMYRMSLLDLVDNAQSWDETVALAKRLEAAGVSIINTGIGWHEARIPTIVTSVPRGAFSWVTGKLRPECRCQSSVQPHQHPRGRRRDHRLGPGRSRLDGAAAAVRSASSRRLPRTVPTRSTPASHATRRASTTVSRTSARAAWSTRGRGTRRRSSCPPRVRPGGSPSSARVRRGSLPRPSCRAAATRSSCSKSCPRSAASSASRCRSRARRSSRRRSATSPGVWRSTVSRCTSTPGPRSTSSRASTRSSSQQASSRASRRSPASTTRRSSTTRTSSGTAHLSAVALRSWVPAASASTCRSSSCTSPTSRSSTGCSGGALTDPELERGGLTAKLGAAPKREVVLLQRKTTGSARASARRPDG